MTPHQFDRERGTTLVELLVTVVILGLAVLALLGGLTTAVVVSDQHRQQAVAGSAVRSFAETVGSSSYVNCAGPSQFTGLYTAPTGYVRDVTSVKYWNAATRTFQSSCPSPDQGAQQVTVRVASSQGKGVGTLDVIVRKATA